MLKFLYESVRNQTLTATEAFGAVQFIAKRLASVSSYLTQAGIAHNDIEPANFRIHELGEPMVFDFGCASEIGRVAPGLTPSYAAAVGSG